MFRDEREHIFIVEDNQVYSMMLDYVLSKDSIYRFSSFTTGAECIRNLRQSPNVVILDYNLEDMNGYDVLQEIKKYDPSIHVIILTNNKDMKTALRLLQAGADDYILKQERGELQILEKVENLLINDARLAQERKRARNRYFLTRLAYGVAIASLAVAGIMYFI